ncbi:MAG: hypothetical protein WB767_13010 [Nocardioides sp.]
MKTRIALAACSALVLLGTSGCSSLDSLFGDDAPEPPPPSATPVEADLVNSQFTRDGTFQSHISAKGAKGIDFVYTLYPTKATPRTNEWFPKGNKYFSFTFQAYDLDRKIRDPFETKRLVYLKSMSVTSSTITVDGGPTQTPYELDVNAAKATFDPEPLTTKYGMLITSPKGAFEIRNQEIGPMSADTRGLELTFRAIVNVEKRPGSGVFLKRAIEQIVPIAIFESDDATVVADIPVNAN